MNPTQPSDTPRVDAVIAERLANPGKFIGIIGVEFACQLERELNQWRACAEKLKESGRHHPACVIFLGELCTCGMKEALEMFEKLKGSK